MILEKQPEINTERWTCTQWSPNDGYCDWESVLAPTSTEGQKEVILRISLSQSNEPDYLTIIENTFSGGQNCHGMTYEVPITVERALIMLKQTS